jgi:hypothetical protein
VADVPSGHSFTPPQEETSMLKKVVHIVTAGLYRIKVNIKAMPVDRLPSSRKLAT